MITMRNTVSKPAPFDASDFLNLDALLSEFDDGRERLKTTGDEAFVLPYSTPGKGADQGRNLRAGPTRLSHIDDLGI